MRIAFVLTLVGLAAATHNAQAADTAKPARIPVLVELFTSEGCSSCPPADELLRKMDAAQPVSGAQLIVLSEHVDYWDHDGWRDPYSAGWVTTRQDGYCRALHLDDPYTPQMIVDGSAVLNLTDSQQMSQVFQKAVAAPKIPVAIQSLHIDGGTIQGHVEATGAPGLSGDLYIAVALDHVDSQVRAGENHGRHLTHTAVVESLKKLGKVKAGDAFNQDFQLNLKQNLDPGNLRIVAFVQESFKGRVLGAALEKPRAQ